MPEIQQLKNSSRLHRLKSDPVDSMLVQKGENLVPLFPLEIVFIQQASFLCSHKQWPCSVLSSFTLASFDTPF